MQSGGGGEEVVIEGVYACVGFSRFGEETDKSIESGGNCMYLKLQGTKVGEIQLFMELNECHFGQRMIA